MASRTTIEWTEVTWNPVTGCDRVSPGCAHCYALTLASRLKAMGNPRYGVDGAAGTSGPGFGLSLHWDLIDAPRRWHAPRLVFVNSMSDLFHERVPVEFIKAVFGTIAETPRHTYQVLTKRHERLASLATELDWPANLWMGVSIENDHWTLRADYLRRVPSTVKFISAEPLLGPLLSLKLDGIDWLIAGGESGPGHRPMDPSWVRDLRDMCERQDVAFFFKQWGGQYPKAGGRELDGREWSDVPGPASSPRAGTSRKVHDPVSSGSA